MMEPGEPPPVDLDPPQYRFADVVVDTHAHAVSRAGLALAIEPKTYAVLLELLRHPGELVTRDQLLDSVWGHRHVTPGVLTRAVAQLRHALGDDPHQPRFIRTRHALGYCFIGDLMPGTAPGAGMPTPDPPYTVDPRTSDLRRPATGAYSSGNGEHAVRASQAPLRMTTGGAPPGLWLAVVAVVIAIAAAVFALWPRAQVEAAAPSIAVLPFTSLGPSPDDGYFAEGLAAELHDALAGVPGLEVVAARGTQPKHRDPQVVGRRLDVAHVLDAKVWRDGGRVRVSAWLTNTRDGTTRWSGRFDSETTSVFGVQAEIAREVVRVVRGIVPEADLARRLRPTTRIDAYDAYLRGMHRLADGGDAELDRAVEAFGAALRLDPSFARAQAGICRAEIARFEGRLDADAFDQAIHACAQASSMAPELREVDLALGELYRARGDHAKAIDHYSRAATDARLRAQAHVGLARAYAAQRRPEETRRHFAAAFELQPNDSSVHREYGFQRYVDGDVPGAIASYRRASELAPDDERLWSSLGGLHLAAGDPAAARAAFERSLAIRPNYAALSNYGSLLFEEREYARAAILYRHAARLDSSDFRIWGNLGDALAAAGAPPDEARRAYGLAAERAERYVAIRSDDAQALALLGWYHANLGDEARARSWIARAQALESEPGEVALLSAQARALAGDRDLARRQVHVALENGIAPQRAAASPVLRPLLAGARPAR